MKKIILLSLSAALLFSACATNSANTPSAASAVASTPLDYKIEKVEANINDNVKYSIEYPVFADNALNPAVNEVLEAQIDSAKQLLNNALNDELPDEVRDGLYYKVTANVVQANSVDGADVLFSLDSFLGGQHANFSYITLSINMDGTVITDLTNLLASKDDGLNRISAECREQVRNVLKENYDQNCDDSCEPYQDDDMLIQGTEPKADNFRNFLRNGNKIEIYFEPYAVATWADGPQKCVIDR